MRDAPTLLLRRKIAPDVNADIEADDDDVDDMRMQS